jgi:hypothetical protein
MEESPTNPAQSDQDAIEAIARLLVDAALDQLSKR